MARTANVTLGQLEKAMSKLGKLTGVDMEEDFLTKAMPEGEGEEMESEGEGEDKEEKTPPPPKKEAPKPPKKEEKPEDDEDDDAEESDDSEEDGEYSSEDGEGEDEYTGEGEKEEKSFRRPRGNSLSKSFGETDEINDAVDVSPFLDAVATRVTEGYGKLEHRIRKSLQRDESFQKALTSVIMPMAAILKSLDERQRRLDATLAKLTGQPVVRKSVASGAQPAERSLGEAAPNGGNPAAGRALAKSFADNRQFTSPQEMMAHIIDRIQKSNNQQESDNLSVLVTQIESRSVVPEFAKACGYEIL